MIPTKLYRDQDGCTFENIADAHEQSVEGAACALRNLLKHSTGDYTADGAVLIANSVEVKKSLKLLNQALEGKLITEYKLV